MKLPKNTSENNVLDYILKLFTFNKFEDLTVDTMDVLSEYLKLADIECESYEEILQCIKVLDDMGLLTVNEIRVNNDEYSYLVKLNYDN